MPFVKKNDLDNFLKNINSLTKGNYKDRIAIKIAEEGKKLAEYEYAKSGYMPLITVEELGNGRASIKFKAKDIAYHEFGTGVYAKGSYPDETKLPKDTLTFESPKGKVQSTQGWEYYYENPDTKRTIGGQAGWFIANGIFKTGDKANAEVYYTSKALKENVGKIIKNIRRGE